MTARHSTARVWAVSGMIFAASMMVLLGIWQIFLGIAAIIEDEFFVIAPNYTYEIDTTAFGWIHLSIGVIVTITGFFLFTGAFWARVLGIALAVLSAVANFFFVPYYSLWSIIIIAANVFVIWSLATVGSGRPTDDLVSSEMADYGEGGRQPQGNGWTAGSQPATPPGAPPATTPGAPPPTPSGARQATPPVPPSGPSMT
jgi:hypothetical protein